MKPLGVDVGGRKNGGFGGGTVAVIVLSSFTVFVICIGVVWILLFKCGSQAHEPRDNPQALIYSPGKLIGRS